MLELVAFLSPSVVASQHLGATIEPFYSTPYPQQHALQNGYPADQYNNFSVESLSPQKHSDSQRSLIPRAGRSPSNQSIFTKRFGRRNGGSNPRNDKLTGLSESESSGLTATATLDEVEKATLLYMREEEKLAHDVYLTLHEMWGLPIFSNIAASEQRHTDAVLGLFSSYGIEDTVIDNDIGEFTNATPQDLYDSLIVKGSESLQSALEVGVLIEETDVDDLQNAVTETDNADIQRVYNNLRRGSENHLNAFSSLLD